MAYKYSLNLHEACYHADLHQHTCLIIIFHLSLSLLDASLFGLVLFQSQGGAPRGCMMLSNELICINLNLISTQKTHS
jgi:hypothetical protein